MKDLSQLAVDLQKAKSRIVEEVKVAQYNTAQQVTADAIMYAPGTGGYASSIHATEPVVEENRVKTKVITDAMTPVAKSTGNSYNLGFLLENGTKPHIIEPVDAKVLHFTINGEDIFAKIVYHPGFVARPHFTPALNKNKSLYIAELNKAVERALNG